MSAIEILYSDKHIILVNKPSGLLSVPGRGPDKRDCVIARVQESFPTARVVHRLDCATSGVMVLAQSLDSQRELSRQFHDREVKKHYEALVLGQVKDKHGEVDFPLITDWPNRPRQKVCANGKSALTYYEKLDQLDIRGTCCSRMRLTPVTGRSHQLRVHMMEIGHAIIGDRLYADAAGVDLLPRLALHAAYLKIMHPATGDQLEFNAHVPF